MNVLVINSGSSSVKFQIIGVDEDSLKQHTEKVKAKGTVERIGGQALITLHTADNKSIKDVFPIRTHAEAIEYFLKAITANGFNAADVKSLSDIHAVGHRVVHGGEKFVTSCLINEKVLKGIEDCNDLAPLHNPVNLKGIHAAISKLGQNIPQVAVFDTSFHSTIPEVNYMFPIPYQFYKRYKIRKYGFHGTSHRYVAYTYRLINKLEKKQVNIVTMHLGNGSSLCAIKNGKSFDTTMGFTPSSGVMMGTRSGDIDHSIIDYLNQKEGLSVSEIESIFNKASGLLGISGLTNDMRDLLDEQSNHDDRRASLAIDMFCSRIKHFIGAYIALMNGAQAIVFTGGIGENSPQIRKKVCADLSFFGIEIDDSKNENLDDLYSASGESFLKGADISTSDSKIKVWVIPTNEELMIARDTFKYVIK